MCRSSVDFVQDHAEFCPEKKESVPAQNNMTKERLPLGPQW